MAWPKDRSPLKPISRLKAQAKSAKHITFIRNTGYTTSGASAKNTTIAAKAQRMGDDSDGAAGRTSEAEASTAIAVLQGPSSHRGSGSAGPPVAPPGGRRRRRFGGVHFWVPNRPAGLISSTIAMMTKMTVFDASG